MEDRWSVPFVEKYLADMVSDLAGENLPGIRDFEQAAAQAGEL